MTEISIYLQYTVPSQIHRTVSKRY